MKHRIVGVYPPDDKTDKELEEWLRKEKVGAVLVSVCPAHVWLVHCAVFRTWDGQRMECSKTRKENFEIRRWHPRVL